MTTKSIAFDLLPLLVSLPVFAGPIPEEFKIGGFALGCQAYTFNRFSVLEAIEKTAQSGGKVRRTPGGHAFPVFIVLG